MFRRVPVNHIYRHVDPIQARERARLCAGDFTCTHTHTQSYNAHAHAHSRISRIYNHLMPRICDGSGVRRAPNMCVCVFLYVYLVSRAS